MINSDPVFGKESVMSYQRLILHYGYDLTELLGELSTAAVAGCWFDLQRQGGCGAGELRLKTEFVSRDLIQPGHWIAFEYALGERWYLGRVEEVECDSPGGLRVQLEGPGIELNEVFPGSLVPTAEGLKPHRYSRDNYFSEDPDYGVESVDVVMNSRELILKLLEQYIVPQTNIQYESTLVESGPLEHDVTSVKFHGEETVRSIIKDLAVRARNASWGVNAERQFFFMQAKSTLLASYQENQSLVALKESRSRDLLYNRVTLTGDYIYDRADNSSQIARRSYRWRGNYRHTASVAAYGERRLRMWVPWIRTAEDSRAFVTEFFRIYAYPAARYLVETIGQTAVPFPWAGCVQLKDRSGHVLTQLQPETLRVFFDHVPRFRMELGPLDPQQLWPEPPHDERWELPEEVGGGFGGEDYPTYDLSLLSDTGGGGGSDLSDLPTSDVITGDMSSLISEDSATSQSSAESLDSSASSYASSSGNYTTSEAESSDGESDLTSAESSQQSQEISDSSSLESAESSVDSLESADASYGSDSFGDSSLQESSEWDSSQASSTEQSDSGESPDESSFASSGEITDPGGGAGTDSTFDNWEPD